MFTHYSADVLMWCALALMLGGFVKGVVGVGFPMIAVPMMSLVIPPHYAAALVLLPVIPANLVQVRAGGPLRDKVLRFWPITLALVAGTFLGGWWFTSADPRVLQCVVGVIVALFAVQRLHRQRWAIPPHRERQYGFVIGAVTGAVAGMAMLVGPMVVMYMTSLRLDRETFVGSIAFIYLVTTVAIGIAIARFAGLTVDLALASLIACIPVFAGMLFGAWLRRRVSQQRFDQLLTLLLAAIALSLLVRALS